MIIQERLNWLMGVRFENQVPIVREDKAYANIINCHLVDCQNKGRHIDCYTPMKYCEHYEGKEVKK